MQLHLRWSLRCSNIGSRYCRSRSVCSEVAPTRCARKQPGNRRQTRQRRRGGGVRGGDMVSRTKRRAERGYPEDSATPTIPGHLPRLWAPFWTLVQICVLLPTPTRTPKDTEAVVPGLQSPATQVREGRGHQIEFSQWGTRVGGTLPKIGWRGGEGRGRWGCWRGWTGGACRCPGTVAETVWYPGHRAFCLTVRSPVGFQAT